jgi:cobalamin biosynthesis protein CbiG
MGHEQDSPEHLAAMLLKAVRRAIPVFSKAHPHAVDVRARVPRRMGHVVYCDLCLEPRPMWIGIECRSSEAAANVEWRLAKMLESSNAG